MIEMLVVSSELVVLIDCIFRIGFDVFLALAMVAVAFCRGRKMTSLVIKFQTPVY